MQDSQDASIVDPDGLNPVPAANQDTRASMRLRVAVEHPKVVDSTAFQLPPFIIPKKMDPDNIPDEDQGAEEDPLFPTPALDGSQDIKPSPVLSEANVAPSPIMSEANVAPSPVVSEAIVAPTPVISEAIVAPTPVISEAIVAPTPVVSEANVAPTPVVSEANVAPSPLMPAFDDSRFAPTPVVSEANVAPMPVVSEANVAPMPVVSEANVAPMPVVSEAIVAPTPVVSEANVAPMPVVNEAIVAPTPAIDDSRFAPTPVGSGANFAPITPEAAPSTAAADPASGLPPFERAVGVLRMTQPAIETDDTSPKRFHPTLHMPHFASLPMPHFALPHLSRPTNLPHIPVPAFLQILVERIPSKIRPIVLSIFGIVLVAFFMTLIHIIFRGQPTTSPQMSAKSKHNAALRNPVLPANAKKALVGHKHIIDGMPETSEEPNPPENATVSKAELREIAATVATTCSIHGERVTRWNFVDGYLVCVVRLKQSIGTYVLQRDETGYTYLGGLIESPNQEGIAELGVPLETAKALIAHFNKI